MFVFFFDFPQNWPVFSPSIMKSLKPEFFLHKYIHLNNVIKNKWQGYRQLDIPLPHIMRKQSCHYRECTSIKIDQLHIFYAAFYFLIYSFICSIIR